MRIFTYMIYYLIGDDPNWLYREQYFLGIIEAKNRQEAINLAKEKWPSDADKDLRAMTSHGKYAVKFYKNRLTWLQEGNVGVYFSLKKFMKEKGLTE